MRAVAAALLFLAACAPPPATAPTAATAAPDEPWAADIARFEAEDRAAPPAPGGAVVVGSSSVRGWRTLVADLAPLPVVNRGFGGARLADVLRYAHRIVIPRRPSVVVVYAGENDLAAGGTPAQVEADFRALVGRVHAALPQARIAFVSIKPSPARWAQAEAQREANRRIAAVAAGDARLAYLDVTADMLGANGRPRPELFLADSLHMTPAGYALWTARVRPAVERLLNP